MTGGGRKIIRFLQAHPDWAPQLSDGAEARMLRLHDHSARDGVLVGQRLRYRVDRSARNARDPQHVQPDRCGTGPEHLIEDGEELVGVAAAADEGREPLLVGKFCPADCRGQPLPELLLRAGDDEPTVLGLECLKGNE